jgi:hypothetical protein
MHREQKYGRELLVETRRENRELRRVAGGDVRWTIDEWERLLPQKVRDGFAARALIASEGDGWRAAIRLGFARLHRPEGTETLERLFLTRGVQEILARDLSEPEEHRKALIARQVRIGLYGADTDSVRAYQMLAKTCGWVSSPEILVQNNRQTILALVTQKNNRGETPENLLEILPSVLEHEPGAARRIDSGDAVALALGDDE